MLESGGLEATPLVRGSGGKAPGGGGGGRGGGVREQSPLKLKTFSKSKVRKPPFPDTLSCFKQPLTKYSLLCFKAFFQRNTPGLDKGPYPKTLLLM